MSIALDRSSGGDHSIQRSQFIHGMPCHRSVYESPKSGVLSGDRRFQSAKVEKRDDDSDSCSSSSIGRNSDLSGGSSLDGEDESEVQSSYKGPLDTMDALKEVLPIRRGISKHYCGKSKSFTNLSDAASVSSVKDLVKPDCPYNRKRKNELPSSKIWVENRNHPLRSHGGGILKRPAISNQSTLVLAANSSSAERKNNGVDSNSNSFTPPGCLPPLHPQSKRSPNIGSTSPPSRLNNPPWRSLSLSDLQCVAP